MMKYDRTRSTKYKLNTGDFLKFSCSVASNLFRDFMEEERDKSDTSKLYVTGAPYYI